MRSGAAATPGSGGFRSLPAQIADEVPEGSGAHSKQGSGKFRGRLLMRFRRALVQVRRVLVQIADKVPKGSGADG